MISSEQKELTELLSLHVVSVTKRHHNEIASHVVSTNWNNYDVEFEDGSLVIVAKYDGRPDKKFYFEPSVALVAVVDQD